MNSITNPEDSRKNYSEERPAKLLRSEAGVLKHSNKGLEESKLSTDHGKTFFIESLILAQDERWRRA